MSTHQYRASVWNVMLWLCGYPLEPLPGWRYVGVET